MILKLEIEKDLKILHDNLNETNKHQYKLLQSKLNEIIENCWKENMTGHFIQTTLEYMRLELGMDLPILESDYKEYSDYLMTESWTRHTWKFMSEQNIQVTLKQTPLQKLRKNDIPLMTLIYHNGKFNKEEIQIVQKCRLQIPAWAGKI